MDNLKQQTKKGIYWKFLDTFTGFGLQFFVGIILARLLSPEDYGITALPAFFYAIAKIFIDGSFANALIRKPEVTEKDLSTAFYYSLGMGVFMYVCLFVSAPYIADFYNTPILGNLIKVTAINFILGPFLTPQTVILRRNLDFKTPAKIAVATRILSSVVSIALAYVGYGVWTLVINELLSNILILTFTWVFVKWIPREKLSIESFRYLWGFGSKLMLSLIINTIHGNIAPIIIGKYFSAAQLGLYNRARGYANLPSNTICDVIQNVTYPILSKAVNNPELLSQHYRRMIRTTNFLVFPLLMLIATLAESIIVLMITDKWIECAPLMQIICCCAMFVPISVLNTNYLQVIGRTDILLKLDVPKKVVGITFVLVTLPFGLKAFCFGEVANQLFCIIINIYCVGQVSNMGIRTQFGDILPILLLSTICAFLAWISTSLFQSYICQLIVGSTIFAGTYIVGAFLFKFKELDDVKYLIKLKK